MGKILGKPELLKKEKAQIVAEKLSGLSTVKNIAEAHNISERHVYHLAATASPEVLELAETFKEEIVRKAKRNVTYGLDVMRERMDSDTSKLSEITGAVKISHDILQLQEGQPTQIQANPITIYVNMLKAEGLSAAEIVQLASTSERLRRYGSAEEIEKVVRGLGEG